MVDKYGEEMIESKIGKQYFKRTVVGSSDMLYDQSSEPVVQSSEPVVHPEPVGIGEEKPMSADALKPDLERITDDGERPEIRGVSTVATG